MRTTNVMFRSVAAGAIAGLLAVAAPTTATAIPEAGSYCYLDTSGETTCYRTEAEVRNHAANLGADAYLLAVVYDGFNFATGSFAFLGPVPCGGNVVYAFDRLEDYTFTTGVNVNNRISSLEGFSNCDVQLFDYFDTLRPDNPSSDWFHRDGNLAEPQGWSNRASSLLLYDYYR